MKITYLYFLVGTDNLEGYFKIGISMRPDVRCSQMNQPIDFDRSVISGYEQKQARENERWLHNHFRNKRYKIGNRPGDTEWFSMDCFDEAIEILEVNESITGIQKLVMRTARMSFNLPEELHRKFKTKAIQRDIGMGDLLREFVEKYCSE